MKHLKVKDNHIISQDAFYKIPNLEETIANKTLEQLENEGLFVFPDLVKDADDITKEQMIIQSINGQYRTSNVMGFIGYGKERLTIQSRFSDNKEDYFFQYLLEKVLDFPNLVDLNTEFNNDNQIFNFLLFLFPRYLKSAIRKGLYKQYMRRNFNDENVKGTIDVVRHISKNFPFVGKIAYSQREFSVDNQIMHLIRHTIEFIKNKSFGNKILDKINEEVKMVVEATPTYRFHSRQRVIQYNKSNKMRHAYYHEYASLQKLCLLILRHQEHQVGNGLQQVHGVLFDGAWLWEEYINLLIGEQFYHPMNKGGKGAQRLFDKNIGLIYPDFIGCNDEHRVIADAKYKPIDNIANKDYLQVLAYMFRFDAKLGYYLYPEIGEKNDTPLFLNQGNTYENNVLARSDIKVVKLGLKIPRNHRNYKHFSDEMIDNEIEYKNQIIGNSSLD